MSRERAIRVIWPLDLEVLSMKMSPAFFWILTLALAFGAGHYGTRWTERELSPAMSYREAFDERDPLIQSYLMTGYLQSLSSDNLGEALATIEAEQRWMTKNQLRGFMLAWTNFDAPGALNWALSRPAPYRDPASKAAIYAYAYRNPADTLAALDSLESAKVREILREPFVEGWIHGDHIEGVADYIAAMPAGDPRQRLADVYAKRLIRQSPEAVMQWSDGVPETADHHFKETAFEAASYVLAGAVPNRAAEWVEEQLDLPYSAKTPSFVFLWFDRDHAAALDWFIGLEPMKFRGKTYQFLFEHWVEEDMNEAASWLLAAPPGQRSDWAIGFMIRQVIEKEPSLAFRWAGRISDRPTRRQALISIGRIWAREDLAALKAFLAESTFSEKLQKAMMQLPEEDEQPVDDHSGKISPHATANQA